MESEEQTDQRSESEQKFESDQVISLIFYVGYLITTNFGRFLI